MEDKNYSRVLKRKIGEVPEWAKTGDWTIRNYDLRMEWLMSLAAKEGQKSFPYLRLPENLEPNEETADLQGWLEFWLRYLGGFPEQPRLFWTGHMKALNVLKEKPEQVEPSFKRLAIWQSPWPIKLEDQRSAPRFHGDNKFNVFVPTFAPQYDAMVEAGGRAGVSLEDKNRRGDWVPLGWLEDNQPVRKSRWQPLSDDALRALYPPKET